MPGLPFTDSKPKGAADFYFAINATFRYVRENFGEEGLRDYWRDLGREYQSPVWMRWAAGGLPVVAQYWRNFFGAEPGGDVEVIEDRDRVIINVRECPAIAHLRANDREILPEFCQHCYFMGDAAAKQADLSMRVEGGNGSCRQVCTARAVAAPQDITLIASCEVEASDVGHL